jgi:large subunit ribosomal protein L9
MRQREFSRKRADELTARDRDEAAALAEKLTPIELRFTLKAGESGQLYGSVSQSDIAAALAEKGFEIDRRKVALKEHIKKTGGHQVDVRLHGEIVAKIRVVVEAEEQEVKDKEVKDKAEAPSTAQETAEEETEQRQAAEASAEISAESPAGES